MHNNDFVDRRREHAERRYIMCDKKAEDYSGEEDRLLNFKRTGDTLGIPSEKVLMIFARKHWDAVEAFVKAGGVDNRSEPIIGRIYDLQNYMDLLIALIEEKKGGVFAR